MDSVETSINNMLKIDGIFHCYTNKNEKFLFYRPKYGDFPLNREYFFGKISKQLTFNILNLQNSTRNDQDK